MVRVIQNPELTLLGVTLGEQLRFTIHVSNVCRKALSLVEITELIPTSAELQIVKSAILLHPSHCQFIWHFCRASDARKLVLLQERALRPVYCNKSATYEKLLRWADLPSSRNRPPYKKWPRLCIKWKIQCNLSPSYIADLFKLNNSGYHHRKKTPILL